MSLRNAQAFGYAVARKKTRDRQVFVGKAQANVQIALADANNAVRLMPKMPHAGEDHGKACLIGSRNHFLIADRAARLDDRACTCLSS